jgi:cell division protease FtsH
VNSRRQSYIIYVLLFIAIIAMVYLNFRQQNSESNVIAINQLAVDIKSGTVREIIEDEKSTYH